MKNPPYRPLAVLLLVVALAMVLGSLGSIRLLGPASDIAVGFAIGILSVTMIAIVVLAVAALWKAGGEE